MVAEERFQWCATLFARKEYSNLFDFDHHEQVLEHRRRQICFYTLQNECENASFSSCCMQKTRYSSMPSWLRLTHAWFNVC
eukprot:m.440184 g.440184  ORF g.440184 m.440184 type:complete len:81 (+) comp21465_c0_seq2:1735-1977(+)